MYVANKNTHATYIHNAGPRRGFLWYNNGCTRDQNIIIIIFEYTPRCTRVYGTYAYICSLIHLPTYKIGYKILRYRVLSERLARGNNAKMESLKSCAHITCTFIIIAMCVHRGTYNRMNYTINRTRYVNNSAYKIIMYRSTSIVIGIIC